MSAQVGVDLNSLSSITTKLEGAAEAMGASATGAPNQVSPSAGAAATAAILKHLTAGAVNICEVLDVGAAGVSASRATYSTVDENNRASLTGTGPGW
ncbi:hypothetical protein SAMN05216410_0391 [Sanguibacter gelidistatuariae]|uniref:Uncharacterized protein n=1 Tax=Sanguibacter gelidistatuariae TaxID=1814289 RepID=A0A1G6GRS2_9MICO|nr:hypothetical protein [Sanguibacter gelidistatuariae]SDB84435.1 hypothetical protein SAMN05216410_0391 [Sanguibacter gelidistatuariae]